MKSYVVDANVLFSGIISGRDTYIKAFTVHTFFSPDFVLDKIPAYWQAGSSIKAFCFKRRNSPLKTSAFSRCNCFQN